MSESDYQNILHHLEAASAVLATKNRWPCEADVRIRHLLNITRVETKRRLLDFRVGVHTPAAATPHNPPGL